MRKSRFSEAQIVGIIKEMEQGKSVAELSRIHQVSVPTLYNWKAKYGGFSVSELQRVKQLEHENAQLKRMFADASMKIHALEDLIEKKL